MEASVQPDSYQVAEIRHQVAVLRAQVSMERKQGLGKYFWQVTYAHTIAYAVAGIFAVLVMDYSGLWEEEIVVTR